MPPPDRTSDATDATGDSLSGSRRSKRQKVAAACDECRAKKIKCDSKRPGQFNPSDCAIIFPHDLAGD